MNYRSTMIDLERSAAEDAYLDNNSVSSFEWLKIKVKVGSRASDVNPKRIIDAVDGLVEAGDLMAIMGPSGSGKTTLLNVLANRIATSKAKTYGKISINGLEASSDILRSVSSYVEQEDALIGSLTVRETLDFASRLSLSSSISKRERMRRADELIAAFGLTNQADSVIGTPIRKGISGGQKRRLSIACSLITAPKILFLDEPTSGLDSTASFEVVKYLKMVVKKYKLIVIASIHQPSTSTFNLFDKLLLLSSGRVCYNGPLASIPHYLESLGAPAPPYVNLAEHLLDLASSDFVHSEQAARERILDLHAFWQNSSEAEDIALAAENPLLEKWSHVGPLESNPKSTFVSIVIALLHRSFIKSYRDVVVYSIRFAMYIGLAIMMGTVWLRLPPAQTSIQPFTNAIFFGSAFISFMAVAYVPAYLEDRATFIKERANGLYGAMAFTFANFLIGLPYLFLISILFSLLTYFLTNLRPGASAFFTYALWLFLDLLAGESLVVLVSSVFPNFVVSLAITAFANGLWMSVGGFLVSPKLLNPFWRYVFHYIDYQSYVFSALMHNEFSARNYSCGPPPCHCIYESALSAHCEIAGKAVLKQYGYEKGRMGEWAGIIVAIIIVYRMLGWAALALRKT